MGIRRATATRILHLGPGAFFRAHMAAYCEKALVQDRSFGIAAMSMRSTAIVDALAVQDCIYTLGEMHAHGLEVRPMGVIREALALSRDRVRCMEIALDPGLSVISMTVTEKGYALDPATGALDFDHADIRHDFDHPSEPVSVVGLLTAILAARREAGLAWPTVMSLDNLRHNGRLLKAALIAFAGRSNSDLATAIDNDLAAPASMVDRITPATGPADLDAVAARIGWRDRAAVLTEPFTQWVIEDRFASDRPAWERHGAILTNDVEPFENAKLRLINAPHSALAWIGLLRGRETVADAMADPVIRRFVETLLHEDLAPVTDAPEGLDKGEYTASVTGRFANPAIRHRLAQIATDSSQKIAQRLVPVLEAHRARGRVPPHVCRAIAAWIMLWQKGLAPADPMGDELAASVRADPRDTADAFLAIRSVFGECAGRDPDIRSTVHAALADLA
ncbi:MAG: mannitol dehydrogenase family protein [Geminicoccaceae bacterium]|nr:mannitol dehydrogenase family protein [Geminicoccaceae bacterium]